MGKRGINEVDRQRAIDAHNAEARAQTRPALDPEMLAKRLATREAAAKVLDELADHPTAGQWTVSAALLNELCKIAQVALSEDTEAEVRDCRPFRRTQITTWSGLLDYARQRYAFNQRETFSVLWLDKKNQLLLDEAMAEGTTDHAPVYPREVARRALEVGASACILMHNHPSGDPTPSRADIDMTRQVVEALRPIGIAVHDHIVVGRDGVASLKSLGHF